jgi:hypothetical protein
LKDAYDLAVRDPSIGAKALVLRNQFDNGRVSTWKWNWQHGEEAGKKAKNKEKKRGKAVINFFTQLYRSSCRDT